MKRRFPKLARWLASIYLVWSLLVFLGTLGSENHSWWPVSLYPLVWPWSLLFQMIGTLFTDATYDYVAAAFYMVVGTTWMWFLGRLFSIVATRLFPLKPISKETEARIKP